ncbi:MAG: glycosyltransferase family 2 protein [Limimaricola soesokkakensis]|uniref:glycosyltransferase family 2 protein n=1 Tax=Limimaricola soesokkakensis TaxID=1343159 RepID=UPI00405905F1
MTTLSLIVTSFDVGPWIDEALDSAARVLRSGDELIVVDDGSRDDSSAKIRNFGVSGRLALGVAYRPILLGCNSPGGVGPAANIGLAAAQGDIVAFLDGDDCLEPDEFDTARRRLEASLIETVPIDILIANYTQWHEGHRQESQPSDAHRWQNAEALTDQAARDRALQMIAVPWRKLYRRNFLEAHNLRFPEGDFFFEDNPFHWKVCCAARRIVFHDRVICRHRIARPGQTMTSQGKELLAFFTHYQTITKLLGWREIRLKTLAMCWLVENMCWHMERLSPVALGVWTMAARNALKGFPERRWRQDVAPRFDDWAVEILNLIRKNKLVQAEQRLFALALARQQQHSDHRANALQTEVDRLRDDLARVASGQSDTHRSLIEDFERLRREVLELGE